MPAIHSVTVKRNVQRAPTSCFAEQASGASPEAVHHEGALTRKHEWETQDRKCTNRYSSFLAATSDELFHGFCVS